VGASIGIAYFPADGRTAEQLMANAETALYGARDRGSGAFCVYSQGLGLAIQERLRMEEALRRDFVEGRLEVVYQPEVDLVSGALRGVEARCLWRDAHQGELSPRELSELAESIGLGAKLGAWLMRQACAELAVLGLGRDGLSLSLDVSPIQLNERFDGLVGQILEETGWPAAQLELELSESSLRHATLEAGPVLERLRAMGVRLALDDFGRGYASLGELRRLAVGKLKIDPGVVGALDRAEGDDRLLAAMVAVAHQLGLKVVAQGVSSGGRRDILARHGCDIGQGALFGHPLPAEALRRSFGPAHPID
jgi:EAL domain-containing protein (putative c-di-GMP-specific phosphodiesterase class I)